MFHCARILDVAIDADADVARGMERRGGALQYGGFDFSHILDAAKDAEADLAGGRERRRLTKLRQYEVFDCRHDFAGAANGEGVAAV